MDGELITQRGVGNGMSLIIFTSIVVSVPSAIFSSINLQSDLGMGIATTVFILLIVLVSIPAIIFVERAQRRIPVSYAKRVQGRRMMGGQSSYLPLKINAAGVIPIIFASCLIYFPAQIAALFNIDWLNVVANAISAGPVNWIMTALLIVFFAYFYTSIVFNPNDTAENLQKQGGFIPGIRPGANTVQYIKNVLRRVTLPGRDLYRDHRSCAFDLLLFHQQHAHSGVWWYFDPHHDRRCARYHEQDRIAVEDVQLRWLLQINWRDLLREFITGTNPSSVIL